MKRIMTALIIGIFTAVFISYGIKFIPALIIFIMIYYEIYKRRPHKNEPINWWESIAYFHAFGMWFVMIMSLTEIFFVALISILNDTAAMYGGRHLNFGILKRPIFPKTSPNKTWGGFIYGVTAGTLGAIIFNYFLPIPLSINIIMAGILLSLSGVLGDLINSKFKRSNYLDDSGQDLKISKWFEGHGGAYDMFDAMALSFPFYLALKHWEKIKPFLFI